MEAVRFMPFTFTIGDPLLFLKKYHKKVEEEDIIVGLMPNNVICLINKQGDTFATFKIDLKTKVEEFNGHVLDFCIMQYDQFPAIILLTSTGKLIAVNLINLETVMIYDSASLGHSNSGSLCMINSHLFVAIDHVGVFLYNVKDFSEMLGIITLNKDHQFSMVANQNGTLVLTQKGREGRCETAIFKVANI